MNLEFVAPSVINGEIIVEIEQSDIESEVLYWDSALIMYVLGGDLSMNMVKQFMIRQWNTVQLPDLLYHDDRYFIMRFKSMKEKEEILMNGPYTIKNIPMLLRDWKPDFCMKKDMLRTIPIWVKLPQLPLEMWGAKSLNKIGSAIGSPVVTDECTAQKLRASYARILVEIDATQQMPKEITIQNHEGKKVKQAIKYEWLPKFCGRCQNFGHNCATARTILQWKPKPQQASEEPTKGKTAVEPSTELVIESKEDAPEGVVSKLDEQETWSSPKTGSKGHGTGRTNGKNPVVVECSNGFHALGDWNEPIGLEELEPC
ncbi:uncharacterized protein LOC131659469 [Vicia villosa]|uniref:uncharacterized protein LOC131659469 n=1 Tax=Vicia villosa TaxID=3911 RepID=UPI00273AB450|nr:uncharacterized protein LOC131659469 [Vicia villosa]